MNHLKETQLFSLPEQDVGTRATAMLKNLLNLNVADQTDKYAPHFLKLKINELDIWFSFDKAIAFTARNGWSAVLMGSSHNSDMHAYKALHIIQGRLRLGTGIVRSDSCKTLRSEQKFHKLLTEEIKKEIIHTSSEIMSSTLGVD